LTRKKLAFLSNKNYNGIVNGGSVMARPKSDKTKEHRLGIRVSDEVYERLTKYTERHEQTITQAVIDGINLLLEKEDN
jgi:hypothetical protein